MISVALKATIRKICRDVRSVIYIRCRLMGSRVVWLWLARTIKGSNQQVRTRRGVERGSVAIKGLRQDQPVSEALFSQTRLIKATVRLWRRVAGHSHLAGVNQAVGRIMRVGIRIFSIVGGLGFGDDRSRGSGRWPLVGQVLRLLRRLKMQVKAWGRARS